MPIVPGRAARTHLPHLDGLRAVAVLLVVLFHADPEGLARGGFVGVDLFFVLSAFLITSLLLDEREATGGVRLGHFYARRAWRLVPGLALFLAAYLAVAPWVWPGHPHVRDAALAGLWVANVSQVASHGPTYLAHAWSLAAEWQFYLVWPLLLPAVLASRRPLVVLGLAWAGATLWRLSLGDDWRTAYFGLGPHGSGLILGATLALGLRARPAAWGLATAAAGAALLAILAVTARLNDPALSIALAEIGAALVIGAVAAGRVRPRLLAAAPVAGLGQLSYGIYLWHYPIARALRDDWGLWPTFAASLALSAAAAALSYHGPEAWVRRRRDRAYRSRTLAVT